MRSKSTTIPTMIVSGMPTFAKFQNLYPTRLLHHQSPNITRVRKPTLPIKSIHVAVLAEICSAIIMFG
jgi:hypothetical protein